MLLPKKNSYKEFDINEKKIPATQKLPTPHNFSNGPSLRPDNPTHPLLNPSFFPSVAQGPTPGES